VNILDEDIIAPEHERLRNWRIHFRIIGFDVGRFGWQDRDQIVPFLHSRRRPTFFTQDHDFYHPRLRHSGYCLVYLDVAPDEAADYIRRFLRHPSFRTQAQRMGKVVRVRHSGLTYWQVGDKNPHLVGW
jgi:hypothetical protein